MAGSRYDFVKVKVWLGDEQAHWYTLSRFLLSRTLTAMQIPDDKAGFGGVGGGVGLGVCVGGGGGRGGERESGDWGGGGLSEAGKEEGRIECHETACASLDRRRKLEASAERGVA